MSDEQVKARSKTRKQVLISYYEDDADPKVEEWLNNQANKSKSVLFLIGQFASVYGSGDILETALSHVSLLSGNELGFHEKRGDSE